MRRRPEFLAIGIVTNAFGIKGEVFVSPISDDPSELLRMREVYLSHCTSRRQLFAIERIRRQKKRFIVKFVGIEDRDQAELHKNFLIEKRLEDDEELPPDEYYIFELIGLQVKTTAGVVVGAVKDVLSLPANDVYVVQAGSREILIPAVKTVIKKIDLNQGVILIEFLDGLF